MTDEPRTTTPPAASVATLVNIAPGHLGSFLAGEGVPAFARRIPVDVIDFYPPAPAGSRQPPEGEPCESRS